jgi:hypothetical protein
MLVCKSGFSGTSPQKSRKSRSDEHCEQALA